MTLPFVFAVYASLAQDALRARGRLLAPVVLGLAGLFCLGGIESTLTISRRIDGRIGLGTFRMVSGRVLADLTRTGRAPAEQPVSLSFGFFNNSYAYAMLSRIALPTPIRWDGSGARFAYRLQKPDDPPPPGSDAFPATRGASATLYRVRLTQTRTRFQRPRRNSTTLTTAMVEKPTSDRDEHAGRAEAERPREQLGERDLEQPEAERG